MLLSLWQKIVIYLNYFTLWILLISAFNLLFKEEWNTECFLLWLLLSRKIKVPFISTSLFRKLFVVSLSPYALSNHFLQYKKFFFLQFFTVLFTFALIFSSGFLELFEIVSLLVVFCGNRTEEYLCFVKCLFSVTSSC